MFSFKLQPKLDFFSFSRSEINFLLLTTAKIKTEIQMNVVLNSNSQLCFGFVSPLILSKLTDLKEALRIPINPYMS